MRPHERVSVSSRDARRSEPSAAQCGQGRPDRHCRCRFLELTYAEGPVNRLTMLANLTPKASKSTLPVTALTRKTLASWLSKQTAKVQRWVKSTQFGANDGELCLVPGGDGAVGRALVGV